MSGVGSRPALATCETRQVQLAGVSGGFPGVLPFRPTYRLARLYERNNLERDIKLIQKIIQKANIISPNQGVFSNKLQFSFQKS